MRSRHSAPKSPDEVKPATGLRCEARLFDSVEEKFCEGPVEETIGNKVKVKIVAGESKGEVKEYKQDLVAQVIICKMLPRMNEINANGYSFLMHIVYTYRSILLRSILRSMTAARTCPV